MVEKWWFSNFRTSSMFTSEPMAFYSKEDNSFSFLSLFLSLPPGLLTDSYFSPMIYNLWFFFIILPLKLSQFGPINRSTFKLIWIFGWYTLIKYLNTSLLSDITRYFRLRWFLLLSHWDWPFSQGTFLHFSGAWGVDTKVQVLGVLSPTEVSASKLTGKHVHVCAHI